MQNDGGRGFDCFCFFFFQAEDGIRCLVRSRGLGDVYKRQILESLREGRVFVAFDVLADSTGFVFLAESSGGHAVMGERLPLGPDVHLRAASPVPCRFTVVHDGTVTHLSLIHI